MHFRTYRTLFALVLSHAMAAPAAAELPWQLCINTHYMAKCDNLVA